MPVTPVFGLLSLFFAAFYQASSLVIPAAQGDGKAISRLRQF
jgi:hypothetical protein